MDFHYWLSERRTVQAYLQSMVLLYFNSQFLYYMNYLIYFCPHK